MHVYDKDEYAADGVKLFLTRDGMAGFALKPDGDIVSAFSNKAGKQRQVPQSIMPLAIQNGGTKADAFDTVLPELYVPFGLKPVGRSPWNEEFKPEDWDTEQFKQWNDGRPDVVFFEFDPATIGNTYDREATRDLPDPYAADTEPVSELEAQLNHWTAGYDSPDLTMAERKNNINDSIARTRTYGGIDEFNPVPMARNISDFVHFAQEAEALLAYLTALRTPENRAEHRKLNPGSYRDPAQYMAIEAIGRLAALQSFAETADDPAEATDTRKVLDNLLEKYGISPKGLKARTSDPDTLRLVVVANEALKRWNTARSEGRLDDAATFDALTQLHNLLKDSNNVHVHHLMATQVRTLLESAAVQNGGVLPDSYTDLMSDPAWAKFGAMTEALRLVDAHNLAKSGDRERIFEQTNGEFRLVDWEDATDLHRELVQDHRAQFRGLGVEEYDDDEAQYRDRLNVVADEAFENAVQRITPNVAKALNSMLTARGGGIYRAETNITETLLEESEHWKNDWQERSGADNRSGDKVGGLFSPQQNLVVISDTSLAAETLSRQHSDVLTHELGHALDYGLGTLGTSGHYLSDSDPEFRAVVGSVRKVMQYSADPNDTLVHWYYMNSSDGVKLHNGNSGDKEMFAQAYSAYTHVIEDMRAKGQTEPSDSLLRQLSLEIGDQTLHVTDLRLAALVDELGGLNEARDSIYRMRTQAGRALFDYFHKLENERLPELMSSDGTLIGITPRTRDLVNEGLVLPSPTPVGTPRQLRPTAEQRKKLSTHRSKKHGLIQMEEVPERGTPEYEQLAARVKAHSPKASMPPADAIAAYYNPYFEEQNEAIIWKGLNQRASALSSYTDAHNKSAHAEKFRRYAKVVEVISLAHEKSEREARFDETAALVLAVIETGMRIGSSEDAGTYNRKTGKKIPTFGGATMRVKDVFFPSDQMVRFKFIGKAGKLNTYESRNPVLRAAVKELVAGKAPSDQVFANTNSDRTIEYLRDATGMPDITNHDTRTHYATALANSLVDKVPKSRMPKNEAELKKVRTEIAKKVGTAINDEWGVALSNYISPATWIPLEESAGVVPEFDEIDLVSVDGVSADTPEAASPPPANNGIVEEAFDMPDNAKDAPKNPDGTPVYLYRAVSEEDWQQIQERGYIQSDGRWNLSDDEGTVVADRDPSWYLPKKLGEEGRILRIKFDPAEKWWKDHDEYWKTPERVPLARVDAVTPKYLHGVKDRSKITPRNVVGDISNEVNNAIIKAFPRWDGRGLLADFRDAERDNSRKARPAGEDVDWSFDLVRQYIDDNRALLDSLEPDEYSDETPEQIRAAIEPVLARAEKALELLQGQPSVETPGVQALAVQHRFAGDPYFVKGSPGDAPTTYDVKHNRQRFEILSRTSLSPTDMLYSTQAQVDERTIDAYSGADMSTSGVIIFQDADGNYYVLDGHHRLVADRRAGESTPVTIYVDKLSPPPDTALSPSGPVAASGEPSDDAPDLGGWTLDFSPEAVAKRLDWTRSFIWPEGGEIAGPDPEFMDEEG